jgi:hypothetical protein
MFTRLGTNTIFFATMILVGFGLVGCGSEGSTTPGGTGGVTSCETGDYCGIDIPSNLPVAKGENPCFVPFFDECMQGFEDSCGWDKQDNKCWPIFYCEPSVPSAGTTSYASLRPASAVCPAGIKTYTYQPGTLMGWGPSFPGSGQATTGNYTCVPNTTPVTINC